ncbi:MAG: glycosyltransferase family 2 protein [Planctomycetota bacterium]
MGLTVSVVTPSFNQGPYLERTVRSVLDQGIEGLEYVVMDGGSKDDSVEILRRYQSRLRWVSEPDRGQAHAVNKGIAATSGDIIGWLNSDDVYYPNAIAAARQYLEFHPEVDFVYGEANFIDEQDRFVSRYPTEPWNRGRLQDSCFLCQPSVFIRRKAVKQFGLLDESLNFCMDYEYWLRAAERGGRFAYVPSVWSGARLHAATKTLGSRTKAHLELNDFMKRRFGLVPTKWLLNYACVVLKIDGSVSSPKLYALPALLPVVLYASLRAERRDFRSLLARTRRRDSRKVRQAISADSRKHARHLPGP